MLHSQKTFFKFFFLFFNYIWCTILYNFRSTTQWLDFHITYELITPINLVPTCTIHSYYNITDYVLYSALYIPVTVLLCTCDWYKTTNLYFLIPSHFHPFSQHPTHLATIKILFVHLFFSLVPQVSETTWHLSFSVWHFTQHNTFKVYMHVVADGKISFFVCG